MIDISTWTQPQQHAFDVWADSVIFHSAYEGCEVPEEIARQWVLDLIERGGYTYGNHRVVVADHWCPPGGWYNCLRCYGD